MTIYDWKKEREERKRGEEEKIEEKESVWQERITRLWNVNGQ